MVVNVIAPMYTDELHQVLDQINFVNVTIDVLNMKKVKSVPVVVRYFLPESAVKVKLMELKRFPEKQLKC